ncbi:putative coenzyme F420-nonreducing hydrogenase, subunit D (maturation factor) [Methanocella conradii HZ254]|uniref:Coenzyme F420-nonreducing hydrogenase, subunit D (Maturation factor) n=1 Tax=Methanocella conradii (strain DSM 24694 / JCM 17849 / CGMCC 1.5162 / HZ254) TaxID=1041930 RepID=H8I6D9_METCZ|nr:hydrogenase maturation protease [Methanocella conradii]AFD01137.1 putative coenzyme F420-nonreducing hydrogenase, subunit D (maturation factor) [Methanocella conradii HZ254]MDI6897025.1 hydrogenase maturation protease [Methanocella conradii]
MKKVKVLGCGNVLVGDDGIGIRVIEKLQAMELPPGVEVIDAGVGGLAILSWIEDADRVIIIDAVQTGNEPPGTVYRFTDKELPPSSMFMLSLHDLNLVDTLNVGRLVQKMPEEVVIIGVEVRRVAEFTKELTPEVEAAMPEVIDLVLKEIYK